jgi:hypothetical protein
MVCIINVQSVNGIWDEPIKKVCDLEQFFFNPTYLTKPITYIDLLILTYLPN